MWTSPEIWRSRSRWSDRRHQELIDTRQLLAGARGAGKQPGELRRSQNWIGGTRPGNAVFVPPPPERVAALLADLERFIHQARPKLPPLVRVALVHAQFETIHPFLDGNGRIGRLLIAACERLSEAAVFWL